MPRIRPSRRPVAVSIRSLAVALLVSAACATSASAVPGSTDVAWGSAGLARLADMTRLSIGAASDDVPSGGVVVAGARTNFQFDEDDVDLDIRVHPTVQRLRADGQPDTSFGAGTGTAKLYLQDHFSIATDVDALADGRTYVTGASIGILSAKAFVARLHADGSLDAAFGAGGSSTVLPEAYNAIVPVAVREVAGGGVLVVATAFSGDLLATAPEDEDDGDRDDGSGITRTPGDFDVVLMRLTDAGALDTAFGGGDGLVELELRGPSSLDIALAADIAADGSATFVGTSIPRKTWFARALIARVRADGSLDGAFGNGGVGAQPSRAERFDVATDIAPLTTGGHVFSVVSELHTGDARSFVRRVDASGAKVPWPNGVMGAALPEGMVATVVAPLADGRTLAGGFGARFASEDVLEDDVVGAVARLRATGAPDGSFDRAGVRYLGGSSRDLRVTLLRGLHPGGDGTIVAAGTIEGVAGATRLRGDAAGGPGRTIALRARLVRPALTRCGFDRRHACRIRVRDDEAQLTVQFSTSAALASGQPVYVRVDRDDDDGSFWDADLRRVRIGSGGTALLRTERLWAGEEGVHRIQAFVDATETTRSVRSRPLYVRIIGTDARAEILGDVASPTTRLARSACAAAKAGRGVLATNVELACDGARRRR